MIRPAKIDDTNRMAEIHVFGWRTAYRGIIADDILFKRRNVADSNDWFSKAIINGTEENYVFDDGIVKGFMNIGKCRDEDKPHSFELWGIYVEPLMKNQGIGSQFIKFCEQQAKERGYKEICLWVLEKNMNARKFYEKHGYRTDGTKKNDERNSVIDIRYVKNLRGAK